MFSQEEIDAVLSQAQEAVETLARDVEAVAGSPPVGPPPRPVASPIPQPAAAAAGPVAAPVVSRPTGGTAATGPAHDPRRVKQLLRLKVPVVVRLAERRMPVGEILKIVPGTILEFDRDVDRELDLLVNNHQIGGGVAVKVDEHFGLRVTRIGRMQDRLQSMTGQRK